MNPTITVTLCAADGSVRQLQAATGQSLMRAALAGGVAGIAADCGGCLSCATCHVLVDDAWAARLPPAAADELAMLEFTAVQRQPASRLSCQIQLTPAIDGLRVHLPATQY